MDSQSNNSHAGHAQDAYPLSQLTMALPSLPGLQAFVAAAHFGSISKAADHLCRTQGAVSRQIQQLEEHYGCELFSRGVSGLTLTRQGQALRDVASQVLGLLVCHKQGMHEATPMLTLRVPSTFGIRWLLPRLQMIREALPGIEVRIVTSSDDVPDFSVPDIDAMVVRGHGSWPDLEAVLLFKEVLVPMCAPAMAALLHSLDDLKAATLLHPGPSHAEWRWWIKHTGIEGIDLGRGLVFDTLDLTLNAAAQGHGVAIGDPHLAANQLQSGELVMPFLKSVDNDSAYYFCFPRQRAGNERIRALLGVLSRLAQS